MLDSFSYTRNYLWRARRLPHTFGSRFIIAGAFTKNHIVIIAGISEAFAGAFSLATGRYLSSQAERQVHMAEMQKQQKEIHENPHHEREEMVFLFEKEGLSHDDANHLMEYLSKSKKFFFMTMVQKELGIDAEPESSPLKDGLFVGLSYLIAPIVALTSYFFCKTSVLLHVPFFAIFLLCLASDF